MARARRLTADAMVGASSICLVVAGVSMINPALRAQVAGAFDGDASVQLGALASSLLDVAHTVVRLSADYVPDSTPFLGFGILALVLTAMMFRA